MNSTNKNLFKEWRNADRRARALEAVSTRASLAALDGAGELPSLQTREIAKKLREHADGLFQIAMTEMANRAKG
jgi:hypothetical protein